MSALNHNMEAAQGSAYSDARATHDALIERIKALEPDGVTMRALHEAVEAVAASYQCLGHARAIGTDSWPHDGMIQAGTDRYSTTSELTRAATYAIQLAARLGSERTELAARALWATVLPHENAKLGMSAGSEL